MLEWNDATKRYRLHDLMRDFARQRLTANESDAAALRHATYYGTVLASADDLYLEGGDSFMRGLALFDLERGNIQAGQAWAAALAAKDRDAAELATGYPDWGAYTLDIRQHPRARIRWREAALAAARQLKNRKVEGHHLGSLGIAFGALGDHRRAIDYHEKAQVIFREIGDLRGESTALSSLGTEHFSLGDYSRSIDYCEKQLELAQRIDDSRSQGAAMCGLGRAYARMGDHQRAIAYDEKALAILCEIGDRRGQSAVLGILGAAYHLSGDLGRAISYYDQQL